MYSRFLDSVPVLVVSAAFLGILVTSFGVLLQALYLAGDMDFLLSAPVPIRAVFITKLLQAILPNFGLICLFALPVLFGLGASSGYNFLYYPLVLIVLAALALAAAGLSSLLVMVVVRIFPARRVAEVLGFVGAIISFACSQSGQLSRFSQFSAGQADQAILMATRFNTPWSPLSWAGRGIGGPGREAVVTGGWLIDTFVRAGIPDFWGCLNHSRAPVLYRLGQYQGQPAQEKSPKSSSAGSGTTCRQACQTLYSTCGGRNHGQRLFRAAARPAQYVAAGYTINLRDYLRRVILARWRPAAAWAGRGACLV